MSRRAFIADVGRSAAVAGIGLTASEALMVPAAHAETAAVRKQVAPGDRVTIGLIGCGGMGTENLYRLMGKPEVEVAALCDVDERRLADPANRIERKYGKRPDTYKDFRELLDRKDIQGVIIATPDHWHALPAIYACEAGKDIYCEKPISHDITEAVAMAAAVRKYHRVAQVGTWQRSRPEFAAAVDYIRSGGLGRVTKVRAWKSDEYQLGHNAVSTPPAELDYNFWLGPAAKQEYRYVKNEPHFNWRWYLNFGSGMTGDWGVHMMDIGLLAMSKNQDLAMPEDVAAVGGKWLFPDDDRTAPDTQIAIMQFNDPDFAMQWETGRKPEDNNLDHGTQFISVDGRSLTVWRGGLSIRDRTGNELPRPDMPTPTDHWQNWLDCIKNRQQPRASLASVAQTTIVCHLANAALLAGSSVRWDKAKSDIAGKSGKDTQSYYREYRKPWKLPTVKV